MAQVVLTQPVSIWRSMIQILKRIWDVPRTLVRRLRALDQVLVGQQQLSSDAVVQLGRHIEELHVRSAFLAEQIDKLRRDLKSEIATELSFSYHDITRTVEEL